MKIDVAMAGHRPKGGRSHLSRERRQRLRTAATTFFKLGDDPFQETFSMITRREAMLAAVAAVPAAASTISAAWAQSVATPDKSGKSVMHSSVFDWEKMDAQKTKVGERRAVFDTPVATLDRLECHITTVNPGQEPHPPHQHPEEELMLVKEGTLDVMQNGERKRVGPGSVIFNSSNELHGFKNVGEIPATYFVIKWWSPATPGDKAKG
jgi:mannose-6-phosphate isomerase-like protein (cupin superfamily)